MMHDADVGKGNQVSKIEALKQITDLQELLAAEAECREAMADVDIPGEPHLRGEAVRGVRCRTNPSGPKRHAWLTVERTFEAGHYLPCHPGKCSNPHGHSYRVKVEMLGHVNEADGVVVDFGDIKEIIDDLDHSWLNDFIPLPTAENIALYLQQKIEELPRVEIVNVTLWEGLGGCSVEV